MTCPEDDAALDEPPRLLRQIRLNEIPNIPDRHDPDSDPMWNVEADLGISTDDPLVLKQLKREMADWSRGQLRYSKKTEKAQDAGAVVHLSPYRAVLDVWLPHVEKYIAKVEQQTEKKRGRRPNWYAPTRNMGARRLAWLTLEAVFRSFIRRTKADKSSSQAMRLSRHEQKFTVVAKEVGSAIETECHNLLWQRHNPRLYREVHKRGRKRGNTRKHLAIVRQHNYNKLVLPSVAADVHPYANRWSDRERIEIGATFLLVAIRATGRIYLEADPTAYQRRKTGAKGARSKRPKRQPRIVTLDDETIEAIEDALERGEIHSRLNKPMCTPPIPWRGPTGGGYLIGVGGGASIVKGVTDQRESAKIVRERLKSSPLSAVPVYKALNYLGRSKWRVNKAVLDVALQARASRLPLPGLPEAAENSKPPRPHDIETNEAARRRWRYETADIEADNRKRQRGEKLQALEILADAEAYQDDDGLYFPHSCDFRGRLYPIVSSGLHLQGPDLARALLEFADGKPITTHEEEDWLGSYVGRCFKGADKRSNDKRSHEDRLRWTRENEDFLRRIASDPLGNRQEWESLTDDIWLGLAAATDWVRFLDHGFGYVSRLPCFVDGTCNGLQHLAALAGDPELARLVNLSPTDAPEDIYQMVADRCMSLVQEEAKEAATVGDRAMARRWLEVLGTGASRTLAKRAVMTRPYGSTMRSTMTNVGDELVELDPRARVFPLEDRYKARGWMAKVVRKALKAEELDGPTAIMDWLQAVTGKHLTLASKIKVHPFQDALKKKGAQVTAKPDHDRPLEWTTPTGWPWAMAYPKRKDVGAETSFGGERFNCGGLKENIEGTTDIREQKNAVSANFVHALDAAALVFALRTMEQRGVKSVGTIHDSVAALASDMADVNHAIREGFVRLYTNNDPLRSFHAAILEHIPEDDRYLVRSPPEPGSFDVRAVRQSPYFFS